MRRPTCGSPSENSSSTRESEQQSSSKSLEQSSCKSRKHEKSEEKSEAMFTALDDADLKLTSKLPEYILKEIRSLDGVCFYHGLAARDLVETKLTRAGDYLIRATDNRTNDFEFILSFYNKKRIHSHLTMRADPDDKKWSLGILKDSLKFDKIIDLINHYKTHPLGIGFFLKRGISKGKHLICHDRISYNTKKDLLGSGNFSDVFRGKMELDNCSVKVAMKNSKKLDEMLDESKNNEANKVKKEMIQEAEVMSQLRHANITAFFGIASDRVPILLIIEFCNGGTLEQHLTKFNDEISFQERMIFIHDASAGLKYIQSMSITHRDIAARNCLISVNGFVKLSDFGLGLKINRDDSGLSESNNFPARWMAPETIGRKGIFSKQSDMWSMGILVWEIFSNAARPYSHVANDGVTAMVQAGKYPDIPKLAGEFMTKIMKQLFKLNPSERLNAQMFYNEIHTHCKDNKYLSLEKMTTINKIEGVHRDRLEHWDGYVPQVVVYDKNGKEKDWEDAPAEMLANVVWREKAT